MVAQVTVSLPEMDASDVTATTSVNSLASSRLHPTMHDLHSDWFRTLRSIWPYGANQIVCFGT